jgi:ABC-type phosphate transport system substrate-binding protein
LACSIGAAVLVLFVGVSGASATPTGEQCEGPNIEGSGAVLQARAQQEVWDPQFNVSGNVRACNGSQGNLAKPTVAFTATSNGMALKSWGAEGGTANFGLGNAFIAVDQPANPLQLAQIASQGEAVSAQTIPVAQVAVAIVMHLPSNCTATSTTAGAAGRLVLGNEELEKIFRHRILNWTEITAGGDALTGAECFSPITRVVRQDAAGVTSILKHYLYEIEQAPVAGALTWNELAEGFSNNVTWPEEGEGLIRGSGDTGVLSQVASTPGTIGYVNLAAARANANFVPPGGGSAKPTFWAMLQNNGLASAGTFADPSGNKDLAAKQKANCGNVAYVNGFGAAGPPASTEEAWNEVSSKTTEPKYTLCGLTYDMALTKYSAFPGTTTGEARSVFDFLRFVVRNGGTAGNRGGQSLINENHDYAKLPVAPQNLRTRALEGIELIED